MYGPLLEAGITKDTQPIRLIQPHPSQVDFFVTWLNNPEIMRHLNPEWQPTSIEKELRYFEKLKNDPDTINWTIEVAGQAAGAIWINEIDWEKKVGSLGVMIGRQELWGQGIGTAAAKAVCQHVFTSTSLEKLEAAFTQENEGTRHILLRLGFTLQPGTAHFSHGKEYAGSDATLTKQQWES